MKLFFLLCGYQKEEEKVDFAILSWKVTEVTKVGKTRRKPAYRVRILTYD